MWTVVSAKWSVALRSQRLWLDWVVRSLGCVPSSIPPEARRALPGLIARFARQIARFSAHLTSGSEDVLVAMGQMKVAGLLGRSGLINQRRLATCLEEWDQTNIFLNDPS